MPPICGPRASRIRGHAAILTCGHGQVRRVSGMDPERSKHRSDRRTGEPQRDMHDRPDLYVVLGVEPSATFVEMRVAHRRRSLVLRSDRSDLARTPEARAHANKMLRELNEAYGTLRNPHLRREYDLRHADLQLPVPHPARTRPSEHRHAPRKTRPARGWGRSLGRIAIVLGFGLLVLWAVLANRVDRREAEAFLLSPPQSEAATTPIR